MAPPPLHPELQAILEQYRRARNFNARQWLEAKCRRLNEYMAAAGLRACVTSVSGGVDSAATLALCAHAMRMEGSPIQRNIGVCQPIHSSAWALQRGLDNIAACGATAHIVDQTALHKQLEALAEQAVGLTTTSFASGQLRSYMRTPVNFYIAQLYAAHGAPAIVMGTGNMDEDGYLAYFCKAGDGVVDVQVISDLHKSEVFSVARELGVPSATLEAPPSADLWDGQTDEDELGFTYDFVELFTGYYLKLSEADKVKMVLGLGAEARAQFMAHMQAAEAVHRRNAHKLKGIVNL